MKQSWHFIIILGRRDFLDFGSVGINPRFVNKYFNDLVYTIKLKLYLCRYSGYNGNNGYNGYNRNNGYNGYNRNNGYNSNLGGIFGLLGW